MSRSFRLTPPNVWVILAIMITAIVVALALAAAYIWLINRPELPPGSFIFNVEGEEIRVDSDRDQWLLLADETAAQGGEQQDGGGDSGGTGTGGQTTLPTPTPIPLPSPTPIPPTATPVPPTPTHPPQVIIQNYQVVPGDTLYSLERRHRTTIALMARYGIDATDLVPGHVIPLPVANPAFCPGSQTYIVIERDTLSTIAHRFNTTVDALRQLNGFGDGYRLDLTQVICVPNSG